jgi:hypothetical protein
MEPGSKQEYLSSYLTKQISNQKLVKRDKGHFILIKRTTHQEEITFVSICTVNIGASNFIKQTLLET